MREAVGGNQIVPYKICPYSSKFGRHSKVGLTGLMIANEPKDIQ